MLLLLLLGSIWLAFAFVGYALAVTAADGDAIEDRPSSAERSKLV